MRLSTCTLVLVGILSFNTLSNFNNVSGQTLEELTSQLNSMIACQISLTEPACNLDILDSETRRVLVELQASSASPGQLSTLVGDRLLLFSSKNNFHGCLNCSGVDSDSVCNRYGTYGSRYSAESIWNKYGIGSMYNSESPFNRYGAGLKIVDESGKFYGYLKVGIGGATPYSSELKNLYENSSDLSEVRDLFCQ